MFCPVSGCCANNEARPYAGVPVCQQSYSGDPQAWRDHTEGCVMRAPQSRQPQVDVTELVKNL